MGQRACRHLKASCRFLGFECVSDTERMPQRWCTLKKESKAPVVQQFRRSPETSAWLAMSCQPVVFGVGDWWVAGAIWLPHAVQTAVVGLYDHDLKDWALKNTHKILSNWNLSRCCCLHDALIKSNYEWFVCSFIHNVRRMETLVVSNLPTWTVLQFPMVKSLIPLAKRCQLFMYSWCVHFI